LELGIIVIAAGGGGIPVVEQGNKLAGVEAVIDKDLASALLAIGIQADQFVMVTDVAGVYTDFDSERARLIPRATPDELQSWLAQGHFPPGTMGPKVEAAMQYVRACGKRAVICRSDDLAAALQGQAGTVVAPHHV
jgi:carbamate kinase